MSTVRIEVTQERTVTEGPLYNVKTTVTYTQGIEKQIFVFDTETQDFSHVATPYDMDNFPSDRDTAIGDAVDYYREEGADVSYQTETTAYNAAAYTLQRIDSLAVQYDAVQNEFKGTDMHVYTGG